MTEHAGMHAKHMHGEIAGTDTSTPGTHDGNSQPTLPVLRECNKLAVERVNL